MRSDWKYWMLVVLGALLTVAHAGTERGATVAPFKKPPTIDGKIEPGEWDGAVSTVGFEHIQGIGIGVAYQLDPRLGRTWCGFSGDRLYIAMVSEISPIGAIANTKNRDSDVIYDDGIEIWLDPNRDTRTSGGGDLRYYQFIGSPIGTILDVAFSSKGTPDTGWNAHWEFANTVDLEKKTWTAEISVPFRDLGWTSGPVIGRSLGLLISRNYKVPWEQVTWFPHSGAFVSWLAYPRIRLTADAPSVQIESLGERLFTGELNLKAKIFNPGPARQAQVKMLATSSDMPEVKDVKQVDLPANGAVDYTFAVPAGRFHEAAQHHLEVQVQSPAVATPLFSYEMKWTKAPEQKWQVEASKPDPEASTRLAYYPSYKFLRVSFDPRQLEKEFQQIKSAQVTITAAAGAKVVDETMRWETPPKIQEFPLPDLADGEYKLTVTPAGYNRSFVRSFRRVHFPWEGNTLGITDDVLPPFQPIKVQGNTAAVVLRDYTLDGLGLWKSVKAAGNVSAGGPRELLAGPMTFKVVSGVGFQVSGGTPKPDAQGAEKTLVGTGRFTRVKPNVVVYEGLANHPAVTVKTRCTLEYDGCMKVELTLEPPAGPDTRHPKPETLSRFWLEIPLKDELMPLFHVCTASLRTNPAGSTPPGEGDCWDSRKFSDGNWYGNFKPYIWLGAEERGLCWFADNDKGWELNADPKDPEKSAPCLVLNRHQGVLTLRVNLVQKPLTLTAPRTIVFGLMASPAKPMLKDWRLIDLTQRVGFSMSYLGDNVYSAKSPHGGDFSPMDKMQAARRGEKVDAEAFWKEWSARHVKPPMNEAGVDHFRKMIPWELNVSAQRNPWFSYYFDEYHSTCQTHPETHIFQSEWSGDWMRPLQTDYIGGNAASLSVGGLVRSHQDFAVWNGAEHIKRGIGLYFDNSFLKRAYDPLTTSAYKLPDGEMQPSAGIWAHREYQKRMWVLHQQLSPADTKAMMIVHMTNAELLPTMVWNMTNLDLEWFYGPEIQQSKYPHDLLRTESLGRQAGCVPLVIAMVNDTKSKEQEAAALRSRFGTMMVHDIRSWDGEMPNRPEAKLLLDFGYGREDCQVFNYWQEGYPLQASDPECKTLLLKRGRELLVLLCSWNPNPATVTFQLNAKALGLQPAAATDAETKETLALAKDRFSIPMTGYGVRLVRLQ